MKKYVDTSRLGLPKAMEHEFKEVCRRLLETYGASIGWMVVYGSVARKEYFAERSDINVMIVINEADCDTPRKTVDTVHKAREGCRVTPFFLTPNDIERSLDVFPIKF